MVKVKKDWKGSIWQKNWQETIQISINNSLKVRIRKKTFTSKQQRQTNERAIRHYF
jgi:hypothetical protein